MSTDRELLEMAAKAAGIQGKYSDTVGEDWGWYSGRPGISVDGRCWNPLTDAGDALRLAVKLELVISHWPNNEPPSAMAGFLLGNIGDNLAEPYGTDPVAATRRAIVRAAAEIGKAMP